LFPVVHACGIESAANDVITNARKVLNPTTAYENDAVLLKVMSDSSDISGNFDTVRQANTSVFPKSGVRFFWRHRSYTGANTAFLRSAEIRFHAFQGVEASLKRRRLGFHDLGLTAFANELIDCWHAATPFP